jgi:hypothetical protein
MIKRMGMYVTGEIQHCDEQGRIVSIQRMLEPDASKLLTFYEKRRIDYAEKNKTRKMNIRFRTGEIKYPLVIEIILLYMSKLLRR